MILEDNMYVENIDDNKLLNIIVIIKRLKMLQIYNRLSSFYN